MIRLFWPWRIRFKRRHDGPATDWRGRRYGEYTWLSISIGHQHFEVLPRHVRGVWASIYLKDAWRG